MNIQVGGNLEKSQPSQFLLGRRCYFRDSANNDDTYVLDRWYFYHEVKPVTSGFTICFQLGGY